MKVLTILVTVIVIVIIAAMLAEKSVSTQTCIPELDARVAEVLKACGYNIKYNLVDHATKTFTVNKTNIFICTSCVSDGSDVIKMDRLLYVALHEIAHVLSSEVGENSHGPEWESMFKTLLFKAVSLKYLDSAKLTVLENSSQIVH
jgi:hypothetical protein